MENQRTVALLALGLLFLPQAILAYEPTSTHDALTHEAVDFYNIFASEYGTPSFSAEERALIQRGAMEEDDDYRMAHHFYDPVHNTGLVGYMSSKTWAESPVYQGGWMKAFNGCLPQVHLLYALYESPCDFSWQRAIYEYVHGDKKHALLALGHTLHLIEDSSVPDHTRNDPHIPIFDDAIKTVHPEYGEASPFEKFTNSFSINAGNVNTSEDLLLEQAAPYVAETLGGYFDNAATYSNANFFSKDTIFDSSYSLPIVTATDTILLTGKQITIGKYNNHGLVHIRVKINAVNLNEALEYDLETPGDYLLNDYWQHTSRDAVKNAAGVLRLFFVEVEKERQTKALLNEKEPTLKQASTAVVYGIASVGQFGAGATASVFNKYYHVAKVGASAVTAGLNGVQFIVERGRDGVILALGSYSRAGGALASMVTSEIQNSASQIAKVTSTPSVVVGDGTFDFATETTLPLTTQPPAIVSMNKSLANLANQLSSALRTLDAVRLARAQVSDQGEVQGASTTTAPTAPPFAVTPPQQQIFSGGSVSAVDEQSGKTIILGIAQGSVPLPAIPETVFEATSTVATSTPPDTTSPDAPVITIPTMSPFETATTSIHISGTAEASSTVMLSWDDGLASYVLLFMTAVDGEWTYDIIIPEATTMLTFVSEDATGNISAPTALEVTVMLPLPPTPATLPAARAPLAGELVINEVAWGGTWASTSDEWIELHNTTSSELDLSGVHLQTSDLGLTLPLTGVLPARAYLVLMRTHDGGTHVVTGPAHVIELPWGDGLDNAGEGLQLYYATTSPEGTSTEAMLDELPLCANWCGKGGEGTSMERWRADRATTDYAGNWKTAMSEFDRGQDTLGDAVSGTPGFRNGNNYLLSLGNTISSNLILTKEDGGYFINKNKITLSALATLSIMPGVVVKMHTAGSSLLELRGVLMAEGTELEPIVFTTSVDDRFGGDLFGDGVPTAGDLTLRAGGMDFYNTSAGSVLENVSFYHQKTGPYFDRTSATMTSVTITDSREGIELFRSSVVVSDLLLRNISSNDAVQVYTASTLTISSTTIIGVSSGIDGFDIFKSRLVANNLSFENITSAALRLNQSSSTVDGLFIGPTSGSPDVFVSNGYATITDATLSGGTGRGIWVDSNGTLALSSSTLDNFSNAAIYVSSNGHITVASSTISDSGVGLELNYGTMSIHDSTIDGNAIGIKNTTASTIIDATQNYWGDPDGPTLPTGPTEGDSVTPNVTTAPFLPSSPNFNTAP